MPLLVQQFTQVPNVFRFMGLEEQQAYYVYIRGSMAKINALTRLIKRTNTSEYAKNAQQHSMKI